ncbi:hypothetical protein GF420_15825 [candidate division GN15 bacterium]|nr:hypothetical protein [candidate division GN15 bacterium]
MTNTIQKGKQALPYLTLSTTDEGVVRVKDEKYGHVFMLSFSEGGKLPFKVRNQLPSLDPEGLWTVGMDYKEGPGEAPSYQTYTVGLDRFGELVILWGPEPKYWGVLRGALHLLLTGLGDIGTPTIRWIPNPYI